MKTKSLFKQYTIYFLILGALVFLPIYGTGRTLIWEGDGWSQHYRALVYYSDYLKGILRTIFVEHSLSIPRWDFSIGEGADILTTLHYYVIGDPFAAICVFFPKNAMFVCFGLSVALRMYFSGASFLLLAKETGIESPKGRLVGALAYSFCYWAIYNALRHPFFINPLVYLPLLICGLERIFKGKRPQLFIFAVFLCGISNFYFLFMEALICVFYAFVRIVCLYYNDIRSGLLMVIRLIFYGMIAAMMSAVILLPVLFFVTSDMRASSETVWALFFPEHYYSELPAAFFSARGTLWLRLGFAAPVLPAVIRIFRHKKSICQRIFVITGLIFSVIPFFGQVLNGLSYMSGRWSFSYALLGCYILAQEWESLKELSREDIIASGRIIIVYLILCLIFERSRVPQAFWGGILLLCAIMIPVFFEESKRQLYMVIVTFISILSLSFFTYVPSADGVAEECIRIPYCANLYNTSGEDIKNYDKGDAAFFRYSGEGEKTNDNMICGISSPNYYWTLANSNVSEFRLALAMPDRFAHCYRDYDTRSTLNALNSVKYVSSYFNGSYVWGFSDKAAISGPDRQGGRIYDAVGRFCEKYGIRHKTKVLPDYYIFEAKEGNTLPFGYTYDKCMSASEWEKLSPIKRQELLLDAAVVDDELLQPSSGAVPAGIKTDLLASDISGIYDKKISYLDFDTDFGWTGAEQTDGGFEVTEPDAARITFSFDGKADSETYLYIEGLSFTEERADKKVAKPLDDTTLSLSFDNGWTKDVIVPTKTDSHYEGREDYLICLGHHREPLNSVHLTVTGRGKYTYDNIEIISLPMAGHREKYDALRECALENLKLGPGDAYASKMRTNDITGTITTEKARLLCLSIPYAGGWSATVDGSPAELIRTNVMHTGLLLSPGTHDISLHYETPLLSLGILISLLGLALWGVVIFTGKP